jgi:hypothetical protein
MDRPPLVNHSAQRRGVAENQRNASEYRNNATHVVSIPQYI